MKILRLPSPNSDSRDGQAVDMLVLHYTGMKTAQEAVNQLRIPSTKVSAHYIVDEKGMIYHLVDENKRAWHAGVSSWRGHTNINHRSIGIEIVNPGHEFGYRPFPKAQMEAVIWLSKDIIERHNIPARNVVGHSDIAPIRKEDPGELFDWPWLAKEGVGLWPVASGQRPEASEESLAVYGYDTSDLPKTITAFQRHFRPKLLNGQWDEECASLLAALLAIV